MYVICVFQTARWHVPEFIIIIYILMVHSSKSRTLNLVAVQYFVDVLARQAYCLFPYIVFSKHNLIANRWMANYDHHNSIFCSQLC